MTTITFYSYKGGVGRSLAVANVAKYLQRFGQKVFVMDLDLEAPGLHYKFALGGDDGVSRIEKGVVDFIHTFCATGTVPESLSEYTIPIGESESDCGRIWLMPAGNVSSSTYWRRLARISWHDMFYSESAPGIPLFLELKNRIEEEFKPDFLLIDSRTGITEVGGVATCVLPDKLVCLVMKNRENLDGAREVLRSIKNAPRLPGQPDIEILPVLTRIPEVSISREEMLLAEVRDFLNQNASDLSKTLTIDNIFVLHSEIDLELKEAIRVGGEKTAEQSPLLRDYLRIFSRLLSREVVEPHIRPLVHDSLIRCFDDPSGAEGDLRALAAYCGHAEPYRALIKLHRLQSDDAKALGVAIELWNFNGRVHDQAAWEAVNQIYPTKAKRQRTDCRMRETPSPFDHDAIEGMWIAAGADNEEVGRELALSLESGDQLVRASAVLRRLTESEHCQFWSVVQHIDLLLKMEEIDAAMAIVIARYPEFRGNFEFLNAWTRVLLKTRDPRQIRYFFNNSGIDPLQYDMVLFSYNEGIFSTLAELLNISGQDELLRQFLRSNLAAIVGRGLSEDLLGMIRHYDEAGMMDSVATQVRKTWDQGDAEQFLRELGSQTDTEGRRNRSRRLRSQPNQI